MAGFARNYKGRGSKLLPCPPGTFVDISDTEQGCKVCPAGGYYTDTPAFVSDSCKRCPNGTFVHFNKAPGKSYFDCSACSQGTDTYSFAGFRACYCLNGYFRRHMFKGCESCEHRPGLKCENGTVSLQPGYWWKWENDTNKELYKSFSDFLQRNSSVAHQSIIEYRYPLPQEYRCLRPESCLGGMNSTCFAGYKGPLCEVCSSGYYKQFKTCKECPSTAWMIAQLSVIAAVVIIIAVVVVWRSRKQAKKKQDRFLVDIILGKVKIVIGFYQVTFGVLDAFAYIKWPDSLEFIGKYSEILQLNVIQIAPIHCLFPDLKVNAFVRLFTVLGINAAVIILAFIIYGIRKVLLSRKTFPSQVEKVRKISETKQLVYRTVFFFLYLTYLSTCSKTAHVLPLACRTLCLDEKHGKCDAFLKVDFNVKCSSQEFRRSVIVAYCSVLYIMFLPLAVLVVLWRHQRSLKQHGDRADDESTHSQHSIPEIVTGLHFLFANYNTHTWYWELVETARKVTLTSGIILIGGESRAYVGLAFVMSGLYGMFFAYKRPIADPFENSLMLSSLAVTFVNLAIGVVSRIPAETTKSSLESYVDHIMFNALVFGANFLVIAILVVQYGRYFFRFIKEWRKNPQWSLSCCLALLLPLNELQTEIRGMTGKNLLNEQVQTGNFNVPSVSSTLKDSGAVSFELVTIHEQPEESAEPQSVNFGFEKSDNGGLEEEDADKVAFDARKESGAPKESAEPRSVNFGFDGSDNGGLEEDDADKVAFDARKESGAVTFAIATIHKQPKESAEPRSVNFGFEESDNGSLEEEDADKVAFDARKESGAVTFAIATIHKQPKESAEPRSVKFGFEESDNGSLEEEDADKVAFDARKESGAVTFALATIHKQPKESAEPRSVKFGFEESDNGSLEEEDADKVAFDARKESGAPKESAERRSVNFGFEESDNGGLEEEEADKVAFDARKESGAVTFALATIHEQPKESAERRSVNFGFEGSDNGSLEEEDADKVAFDTRKKLDHHANPRAAFDTHF
ncbi:uncharacterized protein [Montipora capricornis]|uniref:uncharacterized protein n=1 Tax=Montipora capricornis TaxID=246305 RepID=UPI0035F1F057